MSSETSSPSSMPSSTPSSSSGPSTTSTLILGIVIGVLGLAIIGGIVYFLLRYKKQRRRPGSVTKPGHLSMAPHSLDWNHPAARITPFGATPRSSPRFTHTPGKDMRIAVRRADGAWEFGESTEPFSPSGVTDLENTPSPSSASIFTYGGYTMNSKAKDAEEKGSKRYSDYPSPDLAPPPAYVYDRNRDSSSSYGVSTVGASSVGQLVVPRSRTPSPLPSPTIPTPTAGPSR